MENADGFGWTLEELQRRRLYFLDARPFPDLVQPGDFDLGGMLAALEAKTRVIGARRIAFGALNTVLALLAPHVIAAIVEGRLPVTLHRLMRQDVPCDWQAQRAALGFE